TSSSKLGDISDNDVWPAIGVTDNNCPLSVSMRVFTESVSPQSIQLMALSRLCFPHFGQTLTFMLASLSFDTLPPKQQRNGLHGRKATRADSRQSGVRFVGRVCAWLLCNRCIFFWKSFHQYTIAIQYFSICA